MLTKAKCEKEHATKSRRKAEEKGE
jgi:hypothetical protein